MRCRLLLKRFQTANLQNHQMVLNKVFLIFVSLFFIFAVLSVRRTPFEKHVIKMLARKNESFKIHFSIYEVFHFLDQNRYLRVMSRN